MRWKTDRQWQATLCSNWDLNAPAGAAEGFCRASLSETALQDQAFAWTPHLTIGIEQRRFSWQVCLKDLNIWKQGEPILQAFRCRRL